MCDILKGIYLLFEMNLNKIRQGLNRYNLFGHSYNNYSEDRKYNIYHKFQIYIGQHKFQRIHFYPQLIYFFQVDIYHQSCNDIQNYYQSNNNKDIFHNN